MLCDQIVLAIYSHFVGCKSTLIRVIKKNKTERERERERERVLIVFVWEKNRLNKRNDIKFIQNKMERRKPKYKKEKMMKEV